MNGLAAVCALARWSTQAAAVSLARVADEHLLYVAADGVGAEAIVSTRLPAGHGIAGFVAATGQSVTVRNPASDRRFARDAAEATGYIPASIQCIPVEDARGEVVAVLSILDRADNPLGPGVPAVPLEKLTELVAALLAAEEPTTGSAGLSDLSGADRAHLADILTTLIDSLGR